MFFKNFSNSKFSLPKMSNSRLFQVKWQPCYNVKKNSWKFEKDCLKKEGVDEFLVFNNKISKKLNDIFEFIKLKTVFKFVLEAFIHIPKLFFVKKVLDPHMALKLFYPHRVQFLTCFKYGVLNLTLYTSRKSKQL